MTKKIETLQKKLNDAIFDQEKKKVRYDAHVIVTEGHRRQLSEIVEMNQKLMHELMDAGNAVEEFNKQLQDEIERTNNQDSDTNEA